MLIKTLISIFVLLVFAATVTTTIMVTISKPSNVKLIKRGPRYYIAFKRSFIWFRCNNAHEISEFYKSEKPYNYPFRNKKQAESIFKKISETIKSLK